MADRKLTGGCLCGKSSFELVGESNWIGHCHCQTCRKATASPFTTWIGQEDGKWTFWGNSPSTYQSSPGVTRGFCGFCGTPLFYRTDRFPNETHFYAALLDDPASIEPNAQYHVNEMIPWAANFSKQPHD